ncbi:hypothetical protein [Halorhodospira halochloris]|uniref:hypothetical protein n=1 Tax=Halorhodospira halochloris TaxID=1052 RepID=UPI0013A5984D|nr:hypothetical protein [Halorhodospira halochloris]
MEDAVNPSLEASWRHPWRQDLHTGQLWLRGGAFLDTSKCAIWQYFPKGYNEVSG